MWLSCLKTGTYGPVRSAAGIARCGIWRERAGANVIPESAVGTYRARLSQFCTVFCITIIVFWRLAQSRRRIQNADPTNQGGTEQAECVLLDRISAAVHFP